MKVNMSDIKDIPFEVVANASGTHDLFSAFRRGHLTLSDLFAGKKTRLNLEPKKHKTRNPQQEKHMRLHSFS